MNLFLLPLWLFYVILIKLDICNFICFVFNARLIAIDFVERPMRISVIFRNIIFVILIAQQI